MQRPGNSYSKKRMNRQRQENKTQVQRTERTSSHTPSIPGAVHIIGKPSSIQSFELIETKRGEGDTNGEE